ncbi:MAG: factor activating pos9 [Trizodia sp. TS-e1964]|nr:MAG: factor activating pos9 [Trizodia sp. TS-e1964]
MRSSPNIIITGTPGVGKTSHCELLTSNSAAGATASAPALQHIAVNTVVKEQGCHSGWDDSFQSYIVDEDKLLDALEDDVAAGGKVIDWHACDAFPRSWIDLVVVLRADTAVLYDRLALRGYKEEKLQENLDAEIMQVVLEEAREAFDAACVVELRSDCAEDVEANVERIEEWVRKWREERALESAR